MTLGGVVERPGHSWSHYMEGGYSTIWSLIGNASSEGLRDSVEATNYIDNGVRSARGKRRA